MDRSTKLFTRSFVILFLFAGCADESDTLTQEIDARTFAVRTPPGWTLVEKLGFDTYVGAIEGPAETIHYDQGWMSFQSLDQIREDDETIFLTRTTIGSLPAVIHKKRTAQGKTQLSVYIQAGDDGTFDKNHLFVYDPENEVMLIRIFETHRFK